MALSNAAQFRRDLQEEFDREVVGNYEGLRSDVAMQIVEVAESLVPRRTGRLARSIAVSIGRERKGARGGSAQARQELAKLAIRKSAGKPDFETIYVMVNSPLASLHELGTVKMAARPYFRAAVESTRNLSR